MVTHDTKALFVAALRARGPAYREARARFLVAPGDTRGVLARCRQSRSWRVRLQADIFDTWLEDPGLCEQARRLLQADPSTGLPRRASARVRGEALAGLGSKALPRILELLTRSRGFASRPEQTALFHALVVLKDERAVRPLVALVLQNQDGTERAAAAHTLAWHRTPLALPVFAAALADPASPPGLRSSSIRGLLLLGTPEAAEALLRLARDAEQQPDTRATAIIALETVMEARAEPGLLGILQGEAPDAVASAALEVLGRVGSLAALDTLRALDTSDAKPRLRTAAAEAIRSIEQRHSASGA
ncbi:HEAT repeat domain-containing protein [Pyxidicoccus fallax]|uniref:HEAT repeat domain-containing protein n=1 Tax=Pyxidicoccus fallax TaxID=394095 RepID=A0A848LBQ2_9BACT|nr:HEAT repeat domain-containing protein [Pyxidicoccus fallax]NMO15924.1 HEAT repeat domain-containing protein [Pyxidicoccus fallax]NPC79320.1 HEAT repeat domain-containing protein [Pyxidicoccus fallax]